MRKMTAKQNPPVNLKQKMTSTVAMLLFSAILVTTASYAWFELINAPEINQISANVGANGSLEIALLNTETRSNMTAIRADIGDSLASEEITANDSWGNLIDLHYGNYGLSEITLMPARLNVMKNTDSDQYSVDSGLLAVPTYGYDGRIVELSYNAVSAVYQEDAFTIKDGIQDFGVRGIGTSNVLSAQGSALAMAKSDILASKNRVRTSAITSMNVSGEALMDILIFYMLDPDMTYIDEDIEALKTVLASLDAVVQDIDAALRQGLVAYTAASIGDEEYFHTVKNRALDTSFELKQILGDFPEIVTIPAEYVLWVDELDNMQNDLNQARIECESLTGGEYSWQQIRSVLDYIMNVEKLRINDIWFGDLDEDTLLGMIEQDIIMTLAKDSGIYAQIAEFVDDYSVVISMGIVDAMVVVDNENPSVYLELLADSVWGLKAAEGSVIGSVVPLTAIYGYALDLGFRCNTDGADLMLQTAPVQRIYNQEGQESVSASTLGGGSYMAFRTFDKQLADAVRVGFVDDQGSLLGIAKLNTGNRIVANEMIQMPLYLHEYTFESDEAGFFLTMGDEPKKDTTIISSENMQKNVPEAVTVVVWLDGDIVDNTMVAAAEETSLSGVMNLQFATSAKLIPVKDVDLLGYTEDKSGLEELVQSCKQLVNAGQGTYTTVSWNAFLHAYEQADKVLKKDTFGEAQIRAAVLDLTDAKDGLEIVSREPVISKAAQLREQMGTLADETARLVIQNEDGSFSAVGNEAHTQETHDSWKIVGEISRVDYSNNLNDEGNGIYTPIYSDDSWNAMASALYGAEAVLQNENATDAQLNAALSAMEHAEDNLTRQVFFRPYIYQGAIYYEAICEADDADTYGKWYDPEFRRIVSDLTIVNLDAYAEPAEILQIRQDEYVASDTAYINPEIVFLDNLYPQLQGEEVRGVKWDTLDPDLFTEVMNARQLTEMNNLISIVRDENLAVDITEAETLMAAYFTSEKPTAKAAAAEIQRLNDAVIQAMEQKVQEEAAAGTGMTAGQELLLTKAVSTAKAVEGFDNESKAELENLRRATAAAETLLTSGQGVTQTQAANALSALNAALKTAGADEVTEYNTLTHKLPGGTGSTDVVYHVEYPDVVLQLKDKSGFCTLGAQILTQSGIMTSVSKDITVYDRADGLHIYEPDKTVAVTSLNLEKEESVDLTARLLYEAGGQFTGDKLLEELIQEDIKTYTWASADTSVATIAGKEAETGTVTAMGVGITEISVSVETVQGNVYVHSVVLIVHEEN